MERKLQLFHIYSELEVFCSERTAQHHWQHKWLWFSHKQQEPTWRRWVTKELADAAAALCRLIQIKKLPCFLLSELWAKKRETVQPSKLKTWKNLLHVLVGLSLRQQADKTWTCKPQKSKMRVWRLYLGNCCETAWTNRFMSLIHINDLSNLSERFPWSHSFDLEQVGWFPGASVGNGVRPLALILTLNEFPGQKTLDNTESPPESKTESALNNGVKTKWPLRARCSVGKQRAGEVSR